MPASLIFGDTKMTVNELIAEFQILVLEGCGDFKVVRYPCEGEYSDDNFHVECSDWWVGENNRAVVIS